MYVYMQTAAPFRLIHRHMNLKLKSYVSAVAVGEKEERGCKSNIICIKWVQI